MRQRKKKNLQGMKREETQNASLYYGKDERGNRLYNPPSPLSTPLPMFFLFDIGSNALEVMS